MTNPTEDPVMQVHEDAAAFLYPAALRAAALLEVADHLAAGPRDVFELADLTGTNGPYLRRLLRFLASRGTFREDGEGRFHLTPKADALRADVPRSARAGVLTVTAALWWLPAHDLVEAVRTGEPSFDRHYGQPFFAHLIDNPGDSAMFAAGMASFSAGQLEQIVAAYDFPATGVVVDVGGGVGGLLRAVLRARPGLRGVLFDQETVLADNVLGDVDGWTAEPGDFFTSVPAADLHLVKNVLHDWNDEQCMRILANCRKALRPGGKVLVMEAVLPPANEPDFARTLDMIMMMMLPGQERTRAEYEPLFEGAGLRVNRVWPTAGMMSVIEAEPA